MRDEQGGWLATIQSEDGSVARAFYLECFDGNGSFTYDRIGRGTIFIESCCLSLIGGIQPSRIASLVRAAISGELDDGLIQRLQLAVYPDDVREWRLGGGGSYMWRQLSSMGYRLREPSELDFPHEKAVLTTEILELHMQELGYTHEEMMSTLGIVASDYRNLYKFAPQEQPKAKLHIVK